MSLTAARKSRTEARQARQADSGIRRRAVAVPVIRARLHANAAAGLWVVDAYTLVFAVLLLSAGRMGDRIGARRSYLAGLVVFGAASVLCSLAGQAGLLISARALQGEAATQ